jgi:nucleotide-binding universal stress UspA family protein
MAYRSILMPIDQGPLCSPRTRFAVRLARDFEAHLSGVASTGLIELPGITSGAAALAEFATLAWDELRNHAENGCAHFKKECHAAGFKNFEAWVSEGDPTATLLHQAHFHDLAVLSQPDPSQPGHAAAQVMVEQMVLFSPRPTLLLPYAGRFDGSCNTVMVAWDDSREAARAVSDAMPLLQRAGKVHVVSWKETGMYQGNSRPAQLDGLCAWLKRHGVTAEAHRETTADRIADAMLSHASDVDADLIVMGAYGHARWAQRVVGGATRGLLGAMTTPVLMSH